MHTSAGCRPFSSTSTATSSPSFHPLITTRRLPAVQTLATKASQNQQASVFASDKRPIILFDGVCNICNGGVNFALNNDDKHSFRFAPLQSEVGRTLLQRCGRQPDDISSIVLVEQDACYIKSDAILRIGQTLNVPWPVFASMGFVVPGALRDVVYDQVANNRYNLAGKRSKCRTCDARLGGADFLT